MSGLKTVVKHLNAYQTESKQIEQFVSARCSHECFRVC